MNESEMERLLLTARVGRVEDILKHLHDQVDKLGDVCSLRETLSCVQTHLRRLIEEKAQLGKQLEERDQKLERLGLERQLLEAEINQAHWQIDEMRVGKRSRAKKA